MRKWMLLVLVLLVIAAVNCRKVRELANIEVNIPYSTQVSIPPYEDGEFPIPNQGYTATIGPFQVATNSKQYMQDYNTSPEKVLSLRLNQLSVKLLSPENEALDFMDTIAVYMSAGELPEFLAAWYYGRPAGDSVALVCSEQNLKEYFLKDMIQVTMKGNFNRTMEPGTAFEIHSVFRMVANPLN